MPAPLAIAAAAYAIANGYRAYRIMRVIPALVGAAQRSTQTAGTYYALSRSSWTETAVGRANFPLEAEIYGRHAALAVIEVSATLLEATGHAVIATESVKVAIDNTKVSTNT